MIQNGLTFSHSNIWQLGFLTATAEVVDDLKKHDLSECKSKCVNNFFFVENSLAL